MTFGMTGPKPKKKKAENPSPVGEASKIGYADLAQRISISLVLKGLAGVRVTAAMVNQSVKIKVIYNNKTYTTDLEWGLSADERLAAMITEILYYFTH